VPMMAARRPTIKKGTPSIVESTAWGWPLVGGFVLVPYRYDLLLHPGPVAPIARTA
jgi:hypothetical protein